MQKLKCEFIVRKKQYFDSFHGLWPWSGITNTSSCRAAILECCPELNQKMGNFTFQGWPQTPSAVRATEINQGLDSEGAIERERLLPPGTPLKPVSFLLSFYMVISITADALCLRVTRRTVSDWIVATWCRGHAAVLPEFDQQSTAHAAAWISRRRLTYRWW